MATVLVPNKIDEAITYYYRMKRDGYPLDYLNVEYNIKEINNYIIFVSAFIKLIISEILCIVYANKYFYFFLGKKQLSIKESLSIRKE